MDNGLMSLLKKVRSYAGIANADGMEERVSADEEKKELGDQVLSAPTPSPVTPFAAAEPPPRMDAYHNEMRPRHAVSMDGSSRTPMARVQEIRHKKKEKILPG